MKTWVRRSLWIVGLLIGVPLILGLAWWLLNLRDVEPQPWPEALALQGNSLSEADNLLLQLAKAPSFKGSFSLGDCKSEDCLASWRERLPKMAELRAANPGFGEACEALSARQDLRYEDPLPATMSIDWAMPSFAPASNCHAWLISRALEASQAGDGQAALRWLRQADGLDRKAMAGSRSLTAQMIAAAMWARKLHALVFVGTAQPALAASLEPMAQLDEPAFLARQQQWVLVEAGFQRAAVDGMRKEACADPRLSMSEFERWFCRRSASAAQPEYTLQLFAGRWLRIQQQLQQAESLPTALPALQAVWGGPDSVSTWQRIRHAIPHIIDDVAYPGWKIYFERQVDLQLATEATRLWLKAPHESLQTRASPALRERLSATREGAAGWRLAPHYQDGRVPLRWPTLS